MTLSTSFQQAFNKLSTSCWPDKISHKSEIFWSLVRTKPRNSGFPRGGNSGSRIPRFPGFPDPELWPDPPDPPDLRFLGFPGSGQIEPNRQISHMYPKSLGNRRIPVKKRSNCRRGQELADFQDLDTPEPQIRPPWPDPRSDPPQIREMLL